MKRPQPAIGVTRREVLKTSTVLLGGALLAPALLIGCGPKGRESAAESSASPDQALLEEIADTLLPESYAVEGGSKQKYQRGWLIYNQRQGKVYVQYGSAS